MSSNMYLTDKEFFKQSLRWADAKDEKAARRWYNAFVEVIIREIFYNGTCRVPMLGTFNTRLVNETLMTQKTQSGKSVVYRVPERQVPFFIPCDEFINDVNGQGVTKEYRKRLKKGQLTQRDWERQLRADSMQPAVGALSKNQVENAKAEFAKLLDAKREKKEKEKEKEKKERE